MDTRALSKITHGVYLLGTKDGNRNIGCIVDAVMQVSFNPSIVAISCAKSGYTQSCAMSMGKLSLSVLPKTINPALIGIFGYQSSKNIDKWEQSFLLEKDGLPFLSEGSAFFSCNILKNQEFKTHQVLFAQIVDSWQKENNTESLTYAYYQNHLKREVIQLCQKNEIGGK